MLLIRSRWLRTGEVWFDEEPLDLGVDQVVYRQRPTPLDGARCTPFYTLVNDLTSEPDALLAKADKDIRYEVRRAADRDGVTASHWFSDSAEALERFCAFYDRFAAGKGLSLAHRPYLRAMADAGALHLSCASSPDHPELVWHAYFRSGRRVRLLHSASLYRDATDTAIRSLVGRANRGLHWEDMLRFRGDGVDTYDWGGWYEGKVDQDRLRINAFKEGFGGTVVRTYNCSRMVSLKGRAADALSRWLGRQR